MFEEIKSQMQEISNSCECFKTVKNSRDRVSLYNKILKSTGIRITQLHILVAIGLNPESNISKLSNTLIMERSSLSRGLDILIRDGYITFEEKIKNFDGRSHYYKLSNLGKLAIEKCFPLWKKAQDSHDAIALTTIQRQLIDAGPIRNFPGGFIKKNKR